MYSNTLIKTHLTVSTNTNTNGATFLQNLNLNPKNLRMGEGELVEMGEGEGEPVRVNRLRWVRVRVRVNGWGWIGERLRVNGWGKGESIRVRCGWIGEWVSVKLQWWRWLRVNRLRWVRVNRVRNFGDGDGWEISEMDEKFWRWRWSFRLWEISEMGEISELWVLREQREKQRRNRERRACAKSFDEREVSGEKTSKILLLFCNTVNSAILCLELYCSSIIKKFAILLFTIPWCRSF